LRFNAPHDANARKHRRAAKRRDQDQGFHCRLPLLGFVLGLRKLRDVGAGILESDELAPARQRYGIFKRSFPATPWGSSTGSVERLAQPSHGEFDILRLQVAPALDHGPATDLPDPYRVHAPVVGAFGTTSVGSTGFGAAGAADVAFGATGFAGFSANWLKQVSRSFSSFEKRQSVTTLAGTGIGLACGGRIAS
jgi:hypothetical protein